jgi:nucleoside-diphosphate-sugar epimerase
MTLLITGGAGTLGADFLDYWESRPEFEQLILLDNFSQAAIPEDSNTPKNVEIFNVDCTDEEVLASLINKFQPRAILHFASSMESGAAGFNSNILTMLATINAANSTTKPRIFFPQSFLARDCSQVISDRSGIAPQGGDYAIFKSLCEHYLHAYNGDYVVGVISTTLSPRLSIGPVPAFSKRLTSESPIAISDTFRDYISPRVVIEGILIALREDFHDTQIVLASGISRSTLDIYRAVSKHLQIVRTPEPEVIQPGAGDPSLIKLQPSLGLVSLGWDPLENLDQSLLDCIDSSVKSTLAIRQHHVR